MKKLFFVISCASIIVFFVLCPAKATEASLNGIMLWYHNIFPVLFPCIIISNIVLGTELLDGFKDSKLMIIVLIACGLSLGFPVGGKLTADLYKRKYINYNQANYIFPLINNISPSFVASVMLSQCLNMQDMTAVTFIILYAPSAIMALYYGIKYKQHNNTKKEKIKRASRFRINMQIIDAGIISGFETLIKLCGYIVVFSIIVQIIKLISYNDALIVSLVTGLVEVTNGVVNVGLLDTALDTKYILSMFLASFGGLSCFAQAKSIMYDTDISPMNYMLTKILLSAVTVILSILVLFFLR